MKQSAVSGATFGLTEVSPRQILIQIDSEDKHMYAPFGTWLQNCVNSPRKPCKIKNMVIGTIDIGR